MIMVRKKGHDKQLSVVVLTSRKGLALFSHVPAHCSVSDQSLVSTWRGCDPLAVSQPVEFQVYVLYTFSNTKLR